MLPLLTSVMDSSPFVLKRAVSIVIVGTSFVGSVITQEMVNEIKKKKDYDSVKILSFLDELPLTHGLSKVQQKICYTSRWFTIFIH